LFFAIRSTRVTKLEAYDIAHGLIIMLYWAVFFIDITEHARDEVRAFLEYSKEACKINRATNSDLFSYVSAFRSIDKSDTDVTVSKVSFLWKFKLQEVMSSDDIPQYAREIPTYYPRWKENFELRRAMDKLGAFLAVRDLYVQLVAAYVALKSSLSNQLVYDDYDHEAVAKIDCVYKQAQQLQLSFECPARWECMAGMIHAFNLCTDVVLIGLDQLSSRTNLETINTVRYKLLHDKTNFATAIAISRNFFTNELPTAFARECPSELSRLFELLDPVSAIPAWKGVPNQFRSKTVVSISIELRTRMPIQRDEGREQSSFITSGIDQEEASDALSSSQSHGRKRPFGEDLDGASQKDSLSEVKHEVSGSEWKAYKIALPPGYAGLAISPGLRPLLGDVSWEPSLMMQRRIRRRPSLLAGDARDTDGKARCDEGSVYFHIGGTPDTSSNSADRTGLTDEEEDEVEEEDQDDS
jgi:hypothetical protein